MRWTEDNGLELIFDEWTGELIPLAHQRRLLWRDLERLALASLCGHDIVTMCAPTPGAPIRLPRSERHG